MLESQRKCNLVPNHTKVGYIMKFTIYVRINSCKLVVQECVLVKHEVKWLVYIGSTEKAFGTNKKLWFINWYEVVR